jgi:hypothetical protein
MLQNPFTQTPAKIAVIGLGYVGLPLAVAFAANNAVVGWAVDTLMRGQLMAPKALQAAISPRLGQPDPRQGRAKLRRWSRGGFAVRQQNAVAYKIEERGCNCAQCNTKQ